MQLAKLHCNVAVSTTWRAIMNFFIPQKNGFFREAFSRKWLFMGAPLKKLLPSKKSYKCLWHAFRILCISRVSPGKLNTHKV